MPDSSEAVCRLTLPHCGNGRQRDLLSPRRLELLLIPHQETILPLNYRLLLLAVYASQGPLFHYPKGRGGWTILPNRQGRGYHRFLQQKHLMSQGGCSSRRAGGGHGPTRFCATPFKSSFGFEPKYTL